MPTYAAPPSYPRLRVGDDGTVIGPSGRELALMPDRDGYLRVSIYLGDQKWKRVGVHFLVCEAFHGPRPTPEHHAAHGNGDHTDNRSVNLAWKTPEENEADKVLHGTRARGESHGTAVLTEADIPVIRAERAARVPLRVLANRYGVSMSTISNIALGKNWGHVA